jgi:tRNA (adenine57-N1/adenine58-N1)-methyltransferase
MYETLMRPYETHQIPAAKSVRDVGEDLKVVIQKREDKRQRQIASSRFRNQPKRKREGSVEELGDEGSKKIKTDEEDEAEADIGVALADPVNFVQPENRSSLSPRPTTTSVHNRGTLNVSNVFPEVRGHTSYLTFACLVPQVSPTTVTEQNSTSAESMDIVSN